MLVKKVDDGDLQEGFKCGNVGISGTQGNVARIKLDWVDKADRQEVGGMSGSTKVIKKTKVPALTEVKRHEC